MAEEEVDDPIEEQEAPKNSRLGQFIILTVVVLLGQGVVAYMLVSRFIIPKKQAAAGEEMAGTTERVSVSERPRVRVEAPVLYADLEEIQANPRDDEALRFLNAKIILQMDGQAALEEMGEQVVSSRVRELIIQRLATMPFTGINSAQGRGKLREAIKKWINESGFLKTGEVVAVYFEHFIVQ